MTSALQTMMSFDVNTKVLECHQHKAYYASREPAAIGIVFTLCKTTSHNSEPPRLSYLQTMAPPNPLRYEVIRVYKRASTSVPQRYKHYST